MKPSLKKSLFYGFMLKCPKCGKGQLFKSYLKPQGNCPSCDEDFKKFRADDGPAWLTILITGHIVVPLLVVMQKSAIFPLWVEIILAFLFTTAIVLLLLPRTKGVFIATLWLLSKG